ncbi:hypothetical protein CCH79_00018135, partial [Gambusia affinis]
MSAVCRSLNGPPLIFSSSVMVVLFTSSLCVCVCVFVSAVSSSQSLEMMRPLAGIGCTDSLRRLCDVAANRSVGSTRAAAALPVDFRPHHTSSLPKTEKTKRATLKTLAPDSKGGSSVTRTRPARRRLGLRFFVSSWQTDLYRVQQICLSVLKRFRGFICQL